LKVSYIRRLIEQGEHQRQDFKFGITDSRKIARSLVAFANTDGGRLLLGVKDNGSIAGVRSEEELYMVEAAASLYSRPPVRFSFREHREEGKTIVEIILAKSSDLPHFAENQDGRWLAYVRVHDQNILAPATLLKLWNLQKHAQEGVNIHYTDIEKTLLEYLEENRSITLTRFARMTGISRNRAERILLDFILLDVIEMIITEKQTYFQIKKSPGNG